MYLQMFISHSKLTITTIAYTSYLMIRRKKEESLAVLPLYFCVQLFPLISKPLSPSAHIES